MNIFTDALFLLVYVFVLFYFKVIDITTDNYIKHKAFLFLGVTGFVYIVQLIKKIKNGCRIVPKDMIRDSMMVGISATIGYSIANDLVRMGWSKDYCTNLFGGEEGSYKKYLMTAITIIAFIVIVQLTGLMFETKKEYCK